MRARVTFTQMSPDQFPEFINLYTEGTLPVVTQVPGNRGVLILTDGATGKSILVSLWETEADLAATETDSGFYPQAVARFSSFFTVPPVRETYDVVLHE
jgi:heme-degrading monooxygenase HmoA